MKGKEMIEEISLSPIEEVDNVVCEPVKTEEVKYMLELGKKMIEFCYKNGAVGLACPQIGIKKKMFVYRKTETTYQIIINPTFIPASRKQIKILEGCMSLPNKSYMVNRYKDIQAIGYVWEQDRLIKRGYPLTGNKSVYFQHETMHVGKYGTDELGKTIRQYGVPMVGQEEDGEVIIKPQIEQNEDGTLREVNNATQQ